MSLLLWIMAGTMSVSLLSLVGALVLVFNDKLLSKIVLWLVAFSAGSLIGGAFLHMIPESLEVLGSASLVFMWAIIGFSIFFALELFVHWHHCHHIICEHKEYVKPTAYLILVADGLHNFIDGLAIAGAFLVDIRVGIVTTLIVATHEIPQELGDFGVLVNSGWKKWRALLFNLISGLTAVIGGLLVYFVAQDFNVDFLLPLAAGGFIYVASSDLIPEVKHHDKISTNIIHFLAFIFGIVLVMVVGQFE